MIPAEDRENCERPPISLSPFRSLDPPLLTPGDVWCAKCGSTGRPRVRYCAGGERCRLGVSGEHLHLICPDCRHVELTETYEASC
ncbi:MAG: hypothetical protein M1325_01125 [Actinobacteria bacterium]|nr:hypothetical protein [Actinomycetota bacterium]